MGPDPKGEDRAWLKGGPWDWKWMRLVSTGSGGKKNRPYPVFPLALLSLGKGAANPRGVRGNGPKIFQSSAFYAGEQGQTASVTGAEASAFSKKWGGGRPVDIR